MKKKFTLFSLSLFIGLLIAGFVPAQNPAYIEETFTYDDFPFDATNLSDLDGGTGWAGAWELQDGDAITFTILDGVAEVVGNSKRVFGTPLQDTGDDDIWIYTKLKSGKASEAGYAGISLWNGENEDFFIGQEWNKVVDAVRGGGWGGANFTSVIDATEDLVFLIKIETWGPGSDENVTVWLNPVINNAIPADADATGTFTFSMPETYEFLSLRSDQTIFCDFIKIGTDVNKILGITTSVNNSANNRGVLNNYPNPVKGKTNISYSVQETGNIGFELFDTKGRMVMRDNNLNSQIGFHIYEINVADLNAGLYYYKLSQNGKSQTNKMVVIK